MHQNSLQEGNICIREKETILEQVTFRKWNFRFVFIFCRILFRFTHESISSGKFTCTLFLLLLIPERVPGIYPTAMREVILLTLPGSARACKPLKLTMVLALAVGRRSVGVVLMVLRRRATERVVMPAILIIWGQKISEPRRKRVMIQSPKVSSL